VTCIEPWVVGIAKFALQFFQSILVWPVAALVIACWFRAPLRQLVAAVADRIGKAEEASIWMLKLKLPTEQSPAPSPPLPTALTLTQDVKDAIAKLFQHERGYNWIYGSQWALLMNLRKLGAAGMPEPEVRTFFDEWMMQRKYEGMDFGKWLYFRFWCICGV
jgi:hypothetical protein